MVMNVLAAGIEIPDEQLRTLRSRSIQDVKKPAAVYRWTMPSAIKEAACDHPHPDCHPANKNSKRKRNKIAGEEEKRVPQKRDGR